MASNTCLTCKLALWKRTASGRLHPSGEGRCQWQEPEVNLPEAFYWIGRGAIGGGFIDRRQPHENCLYYEAKGGDDD